MDLELYQECETKKQAGTPVHVGDAVFYVRRWGTEDSDKCVREIKFFLAGPFHKHNDSSESLVVAHWLCEHGVTGWENVYLDSKPLKYSDSAARRIFMNPDYHLSLNQILFQAALSFENYLKDMAEEDAEAVKKP